MTYLNDRRKRVPGGRLLISVEMVPKTVAESLPAGKGRSEPQALPKPTGISRENTLCELCLRSLLHTIQSNAVECNHDDM